MGKDKSKKRKASLQIWPICISESKMADYTWKLFYFFVQQLRVFLFNEDECKLAILVRVQYFPPLLSC